MTRVADALEAAEALGGDGLGVDLPWLLERLSRPVDERLLERARETVAVARSLDLVDRDDDEPGYWLALGISLALGAE